MSTTDDLGKLSRQAVRGDVWAQFTLGEMYRKGEDAARDPTEAARWYRMASEGLHRTSTYLLGLMYLRGEGVPEDHAEAFQLLYQATTGGHREAAQILGRMYENGQGVARDMERAAWWLGVAAKPEWGETYYLHGLLPGNSARSRRAAEVDVSADGGLFMMTGPVDGLTCRTCLDDLKIVRTAGEWELLEPKVFTSGLHEGCRCSWRRIHRVDCALQEMQNTIRMQVDVQKFKRGIYWKPIVILGGDYLRGPE
jgi:hypothetical protein